MDWISRCILCHMAGVKEAQASVMSRRRSCIAGRGVAYTCTFMSPHKKKSNGVKSETTKKRDSGELTQPQIQYGRREVVKCERKHDMAKNRTTFRPMETCKCERGLRFHTRLCLPGL
ncbi:hypothetical protein AVEN_95227-1 [Araneus ventricosus]|uniref:Uncharacterized protein n=1 Tax=Araneus ventricosus TaxID=182803 RepID=A0A4Y2DFL4_ARAVE|nr:hypothetical protein AVEN_95227-1 [Araneus ventricosus]